MLHERLERPALLLLDAGNTLVFLDHEALSRAAAEAGLLVTGEALARAEPMAKRHYERTLKQGASHEDAWAAHMVAIYETAGLSPEGATRATTAARREHDQFNLWRRVPAGLEDALLRAKRAGMRLGIVSNSEGQLKALLDRLNLSHHFEQVVDSALEGVRKPDPEIFRRALTRFGVEARDALYAGDIPAVDVEGAQAAGMRAALIDPFDHYPDHTQAPRFDSVAALISALGA